MSVRWIGEPGAADLDLAAYWVDNSPLDITVCPAIISGVLGSHTVPPHAALADGCCVSDLFDAHSSLGFDLKDFCANGVAVAAVYVR